MITITQSYHPGRKLLHTLQAILLGWVMLSTPGSGPDHTDTNHADRSVPTRLIYHSANYTPEQVMHRIEALTGSKVSRVRSMSAGSHVLEISHPGTRSDTLKMLKTLQSDNIISYGQLDASVQVTTNPNDELFSAQWQLSSGSSSVAALNMEKTWEITTGSPDNIIAVIDTGVRFEHADLTNRLLTGYDFVSGLNELPGTNGQVESGLNFIKSHDGDGRDSNPTDPGDGVDADLKARMSAAGIDCPMINSTWHGTAMSSLLAANGNDKTGMTGIDWHARILPVRAIGRCGGNRSDLLDAIRWAAGVKDPALPLNPNPARIINLSLGINDSCGPADQLAIDDAVAAGAIIVAAVGNQGRNLDRTPAAPADCDNVIGVAAVNASGQRASYSNFGYDADIAAPGGEDLTGDGQQIIVAANNGITTPVPGSSHRYTTGTSVASPMVAGVLALMLSVNPALTNEQLESLLLHSSKPFATTVETPKCSISNCGAGMLDAYAAVTAARRALTEEPPVYVKPQFDGASFATSFASEQITTGAGCTINTHAAPDPVWLLMIAGSWLLRRRSCSY